MLLKYCILWYIVVDKSERGIRRMYKILIIEDDLVMAGAIKKEMEAWGNEARYLEDFAKVL